MLNFVKKRRLCFTVIFVVIVVLTILGGIALMKANDLLFFALKNDILLSYSLYQKFPDFLKKQAITSYRKYATDFVSIYTLIRFRPKNFRIPDDFLIFCFESDNKRIRLLALDYLCTDYEQLIVSPTVEKKLIEYFKNSDYFEDTYISLLLEVNNFNKKEKIKELIPLLNKKFPKKNGGSLYEFTAEPNIYGSHLKMGGKIWVPYIDDELEKKLIAYLENSDFDPVQTVEVVDLLVLHRYDNAEKIKKLIPLLNKKMSSAKDGGPQYEFTSEPNEYGSHLKIGGKLYHYSFEKIDK